jgi:hypothetical protein
MNYQPESHASEPFPWLGICLWAGVAVVVEALAVFGVLSWFDCDILEDF